MLGETGKRVPHEIVARMHVDYCKPMSWTAVARIYGVSPKGVRDMFRRRGLAIRQDPRGASKKLPNGQVAPVPKLTPSELDALIAGCTKLRVPKILKQEWRGWTLERRAQFIRRLRVQLNSPHDMPATPMADGLVRFDYGTREAHEICTRGNEGRSSQKAGIKINICSQGVIWRGHLWFWCHKVGYQRGPWSKDDGRPALHHVVWEEANGRAVPAHHVLRFADGNKNNISPFNLVLATRNDLARTNQATHLNRRSRELTGILLARSAKANLSPHDVHADTLSQIARAR